MAGDDLTGCFHRLSIRSSMPARTASTRTVYAMRLEWKRSVLRSPTTVAGVEAQRHGGNGSPCLDGVRETAGKESTPAATRTRDPRLRRPLLCPTELRARGGSCTTRQTEAHAKRPVRHLLGGSLSLGASLGVSFPTWIPNTRIPSL